MRILVVGARGFLGAHLVARARATGLDVVAGYRDASGAGAVSIDLCDPASVAKAFQRVSPDVVINSAAYGLNYAQQDLSEALAVNVQGSLRLLAAARDRGVRRFVHIGTCFEYGSYPTPIDETAALNPTALYGATKAAATVLMKERAVALGVPLVVLRPFGIWGPNDAAHHLIPQVVAACVKRVPLKLTPCEVIRDYMYVEDLAAGILDVALLRDLDDGLTINMATGRGIVLREFILAIAKELDGVELMQFGALPYRPTEMHSLVADVNRMRQLLREPARTPLQEGVRRMMAAPINKRR
jgi:nucleoside-diphosphate-sugar epimerase